MWSAIALLGVWLAMSLTLNTGPAPRKITQADINAAVLKTLETQPLPSEYAKAYETIRPSVVRVVSYVKKSRLKDEKAARLHAAKPKPLGPAQGGDRQDGAGDEEIEAGVGTGVVIVDKGIILTNLHVGVGRRQRQGHFSPTASRPRPRSPEPSRRTTWRCCRAHKIPDAT